ncbi:MAG TPA: HEAT repeat domain-containing protein [Rectinemataceae bacterium]|nr:HEAT repeat domain-containing protein [Rectinemataceae bacterium]
MKRSLRALPLALCLLAFGLPLSAADLPPLFRLSVGGRPLAPPLLDTSRNRAAVWFLSEDDSLYLLSEGGELRLKQALPSPRPWLALDPFGRALVLLDGGGQPYLGIITATGNLAWRLPLGDWLDPSQMPDLVAFGPDGRYLLGSGRSLLCLAPSGRRLWRYSLPTPPSCPAILDASGNFLIGLSDGRLLFLSPYGEKKALFPAGEGSAVSVLGRFGADIIVGHEDGRLVLLKGSGSELSLATMAAAPRALASTLSARPAAGILAAIDAKGNLEVFDGRGRRLWGVSTAIAEASVLMSTGRIVVTGLGRATSYSNSGLLLRSAGISHAIAPALLTPGGLLFSAGEDWVLAAYRYEGPLDAAVATRPPACPSDPSALRELGLFDPSAADEDRQLALVLDIEKSLDSATIGGSEAGDRAILEAIAAGSLSTAGQSASRQKFRLFARPRVEACRVLGEIGSPAALGALADIAVSGEDSAVRAAALEAIGAIGVDPDGLAAPALALGGWGGHLDDEVAWALVDAIESQALGSGASPSIAVVRSLMALSGPPFPNAVSVRARAVLGRLVRAQQMD